VLVGGDRRGDGGVHEDSLGFSGRPDRAGGFGMVLENFRWEGKEGKLRRCIAR
jgi:hypothetical protein